MVERTMDEHRQGGGLAPVCGICAPHATDVVQFSKRAETASFGSEVTRIDRHVVSEIGSDPGSIRRAPESFDGDGDLA